MTARSEQAQLTVLALNTGSSSIKFGLFRTGAHGVDTLLAGEIDGIGDRPGEFSVRNGRGVMLFREAATITDQAEAFARITAFLHGRDIPIVEAVGHRVVHGGARRLRHCRIDEAVFSDLEKAGQFAPLHAPGALQTIRNVDLHFPEIPQVACLDTAFHADLPDVARVLPIARDLEAQGLRRYGFHGVSCESILHRIGADCPKRVIVAHLGSGASVTAIGNGKSADTSMGLTPAGGVVMATRSGDLDPGVLSYLLRHKRFDAAQLEQEFDRHAGLRAVSGIGGDMRMLRNEARANADARLAIDIFCQSVRKQIAAMAAVLGGVELLVFTGGIGANDPESRIQICAGLEWMGVRLDEARNRRAENPVGANGGSVNVLVLSADEEEQIARTTWRLLRCGIVPAGEAE